MDPEQLPLRDIHLPGPVPWWPPAPGWWILTAVLVVIFVVTVWRFFRHRSRYRRAAARELRQLAAAYKDGGDAAAMVKGLSTLLRRAAITAGHRYDIAPVSGAQWLQWLDDGFDDKPFTQGPGAILADGPYRAPGTLPDADTLDELVRLCRRRLKRMLA